MASPLGRQAARGLAALARTLRAAGGRLRPWAEALAALLYRRTCAGCGQTGAALCPSCVREWEPASSGPLEGELAKRGLRAAGVWVSARYGGRVRRLLHAFKYEGRTDLAPCFAEHLAALSGFPDGEWCVVPVPLHRRRRRERGYNQSWLLARAIAAQRGLRCLDALERVRATSPQHGLNRTERQDNLAGAFRIRRPVRGERVLLVDDIATTGATLFEAAAVLRAAGALEVAVAVVAHTPPPEATRAPAPAAG